jgi:hypothetical protein
VRSFEDGAIIEISHQSINLEPNESSSNVVDGILLPSTNFALIVFVPNRFNVEADLA